MRKVVNTKKVETVLEGSPTASGSVSEEFTLESDSVLISVSATSISGTLDIVVYTVDSNNQEETLLTFDTLTEATTSPVISKAEHSLARVKITATYTDACDFKVMAKGISQGEISIGNTITTENQKFNTFDAVKTTINASTATRIKLPIETGRAIIRHKTAGAVVYFGKSATITADGDGTFFLNENDVLAVEMHPDQDNNLFAITSSGTFSIYAAGVYNE